MDQPVLFQIGANMRPCKSSKGELIAQNVTYLYERDETCLFDPHRGDSVALIRITQARSMRKETRSYPVFSIQRCSLFTYVSVNYLKLLEQFSFLDLLCST